MSPFCATHCQGSGKTQKPELFCYWGWWGVTDAGTRGLLSVPAQSHSFWSWQDTVLLKTRVTIQKPVNIFSLLPAPPVWVRRGRRGLESPQKSAVFGEMVCGHRRHCGLQLHSLRQAAGRAGGAPDLWFTVLHFDKTAKQYAHTRRLLEPTAQPFTPGTSSFGLCSNCTSIQSTVNRRKRKIVFLVRTRFLHDFSSKTQERHPKETWGSVSKFWTSGRPGELPAPHPLCIFPRRRGP